MLVERKLESCEMNFLHGHRRSRISCLQIKERGRKKFWKTNLEKKYRNTATQDIHSELRKVNLDLESRPRADIHQNYSL